MGVTAKERFYFDHMLISWLHLSARHRHNNKLSHTAQYFAFSGSFGLYASPISFAFFCSESSLPRDKSIWG